jgi:hypothetical protein
MLTYSTNLSLLTGETMSGVTRPSPAATPRDFVLCYILNDPRFSPDRVRQNMTEASS